MTREKKCPVILALIVTAAWFLSIPAGLAQSTPDFNNNLPPFGAFHGSDFDIVTLSNGNLHISIPILNVPQRGKAFNYSYVFDTPTFNLTMHTSPHLPPYWTVAPGTYYGWGLISPGVWVVGEPPQGSQVQITCQTGKYYYSTNYVATDSEGTQHPLAVTAIQDPYLCAPPQTLKGPTLDGTGVLVDATQSVPLVRLKDGTQVSNTIEDSNGNIATTNADTLNRNLLTQVSAANVNYTTPLGQTISGPQYQTWTYHDSNGASQVWRVDYTALDMNDGACTGLQHCTDLNKPKLVPRQLTLPTGRSYQFAWVNNSGAELQQITLPTGGYITYTYQHRCQNLSGGPVSACRMAVASRTVNDGSTSATWTYTGSTVTDPCGNDEVHYLADPGLSGSLVDTKVQSWAGSSTSGGTLLKVVVTTYAWDGNPVNAGKGVNLRPIRVDTTLENGQTRSEETDYETFTYTYEGGNATGSRLNPTSIREYDYGAATGSASNPGARGPLLRTTTFTYLHTGNQPYVDRNVVDRVVTKTVYQGASTQLAQTVKEYDNYSHSYNGQVLSMQSSGAVQHDANYGTSFTIRGNVSAVQEWRNTDGKFLTTIRQYDDAGNVISTVDPLLHQTMYDFTDSWINSTCAPSPQGKAYLTKVTNAIGQITSYKYNSCTASLASITDPNQKTTSATYDLMGRITQTSFADGGLTSGCFSDISGATCYSASTPVSVTHTQKVTGVLNKVDTVILDGLGRVTQTQLNSDPDGVTYVDTAYNKVDKICSVSNPHRSPAAATDGISQYQYDALGRITQLVPPDGTPPIPNTSCPSPATSCGANNVCTTYSGATTTIVDQAGKSRKSQIDGLGHLIFVWEDPAALNYETDYSYDALDNLTSVIQKGGATTASWRTRSFQYNSLSHLTHAVIPESGTISYSYDDDGNLITKTAPKQNQLGTATVSTTYSYDALNRLTGKSYNDGSTPSVQFAYDGSNPTGCSPPGITPSATNLIGRRSGMCDSSGATAWSYDPLGRQITEKRTINGTSAITNSIGYTYNYDGSVATITYPGSLRSITYTLAASGANTASRPASAQDIANGINYVTAANYAPQGVLSGLTNGASTNERFTFNSRLQPLQIYYGTNAPPSLTGNTCPGTVGNIMHRVYSFSLGTNDNGNVQVITNCRDTTRTQNFDYDSLNRIAHAYTTGNANWGETYTIDPWGNLTNIGPYPNKVHYENLSAAPASTANQLPGFGYDAAGNMTGNGSASYVYDAENRLAATAGYTYVYDADGRRVKKCSNSNCSAGTLYWRNTGGDPLVETTVSGTATEEYIFFNGSRAARNDIAGNVVHYYFSDHLGSADVVTSATGIVQSESDYYPYGGEIVITTGDSNNYKFTGKERDAESGLDNFGARYYGNALGRFTSTDPKMITRKRIIDPQQWNMYSYVRNNPLGYVDPDGRELKPADVQLAAALTRAMKSETVRAALAPYMGKDHDLVVKRGSLGNEPNEPDRKRTGLTNAPINLSTQTCSSATNCATNPATLRKTVTITIDDTVKEGKGHDQLDGVLKHEVSHTNDAAKDPQGHLDEEEATKNIPHHDDKPQEQRADQFSENTQKEVDQYEKHESNDQKREDRRQEKPE